jgi:hypothetical protein
MTRLLEILRDSDSRRPVILSAAAVAVWVIFAVLILNTGSSVTRASSDISSSGKVLDYAIRFRAFPRTVIAPGPNDDPLGAMSDIVDALKLREKIRQLSSNPSGVVAQFEKLYGGELGELLRAMDKAGLYVKTAEIKSLPGEGGKLLSAQLTLEASQ